MDRKFYEVTTRFFDNGKVEALLQIIRAEALPENTYKEFEKFDEYRDYFRTLKEAEAYRADSLNA